MNIKATLSATLLSAAAMLSSATASAQVASNLMTPETLWAMGRIGSVNISPDGNRLLYCVTHYSKEENKGTSRIYQTTTGLRTTADSDTELALGSNASYTPDGQHILFLRGGSLYVVSAAGGEQQKVEDDIDDYLLSPDGTKIILVRQVPTTTSIEATEPDLPLSTGMVINDLMYKHWDHYVKTVPHPFVGSFDGRHVSNLVDILQGEPYECPMEPFGGAEQLAWSPDSKFIAYTCRKKTGRDYAISTDSDIFLYDVAQHKTTYNLCKPADYVDPSRDATQSLEHQAVNSQNYGDCNMGYDQNPQFSPDGRYVAWISMERDGYESDRQRLCVYDFLTGEKRYITETFESNVNEFVWSPKYDELYFTGVWHGCTNVYYTNLEGKVEQANTPKDTADYVLCGITPDGKDIIVKRHSMQYPDDIFKLNIRGEMFHRNGSSLENSGVTIRQTGAKPRRITNVNADIYNDLAVGDVKARWVKTTDGKQMLCWVVYPPHFDATKKYPALLFCEGGPQSPVSQFWSYRWNFQIMAANGYIVIAPNRRGLPGFGMEWLEQISGDYTGQCMQDYLSAIDDLATEDYVDANRLGAVGASFGGFSVYWLAGNHQGRFKAFIAHDGIYNTQQQYVETEEMWFPNWDLGGAPWLKLAQGEMQKAYAQSPHLYVDKWDTPILCIHGQRDFRIEYTQAESAFNAARMLGIDAQMLLFPDENHWVLKPQNGILWQRTFFRFLDKHLK